jgi:hypothetical protein
LLGGESEGGALESRNVLGALNDPAGGGFVGKGLLSDGLEKLDSAGDVPPAAGFVGFVPSVTVNCCVRPPRSTVNSTFCPGGVTYR